MRFGKRRLHNFRVDNLPPLQTLALERAIENVGNQSKLAIAVGVKPQAVQQWLLNGVPAERVIAVAAATGFKVLPHELRPDVYPHASDGVPAEFKSAMFDGLDPVLTDSEKAWVHQAVAQGPEAAVRFIQSLDLAVSVRSRLLAAAKKLEGRTS